MFTRSGLVADLLARSRPDKAGAGQPDGAERSAARPLAFAFATWLGLNACVFVWLVLRVAGSLVPAPFQVVQKPEVSSFQVPELFLPNFP